MLRYLTVSADCLNLNIRDERYGSMSLNELGLSDELSAALVEWVGDYQVVIPMTAVERTVNASLIDELDREGTSLAERIQNEVGVPVKVRYYSEGRLEYMS